MYLPTFFLSRRSTNKMMGFQFVCATMRGGELRWLGGRVGKGGGGPSRLKKPFYLFLTK